MKVPALLTTLLVVAAGVAEAQSPSYPAGGPAPGTPMTNQAQYGGGMGGCGRTVAITDECGLRYDSEGNRLNARGCVVTPPVTPPGAGACRR